MSCGGLPKGGKDSGVECDTKTPGCETMCIDSFFPISPERVTNRCHQQLSPDFRFLTPRAQMIFL